MISASAPSLVVPPGATPATARMPPEMWLEVFAHLPPTDVYQGVGQTSRGWRALAQAVAGRRMPQGLRTAEESPSDGWAQAAAATRLHHTLQRAALSLGNHQSAMCGVALSSDGRRAYTADTRGIIRQIALTPHPHAAPSGPLVPDEQVVARAPCLASHLSDMQMLSGETHMLVAGTGGVFAVDLGPQPQAPRMLGASWLDAAFCVAASADADTVVTGARDARLRLWHANRYDAPFLQLKAPASHASPAGMAYFLDCAIAPDKSFVVGLHATGQCFMWRLASAAPKAFYVGDRPSKAMSLSPDGHPLALSCTDGCLYLRETLREAPFVPVIKHVYLHAESASALAFSPDGRRLAVGCATGEIYVWDWQRTASTLGPYIGSHQGPVMSLSWSADQQRLLSGADEIGGTRLWPVPRARS